MASLEASGYFQKSIEIVSTTSDTSWRREGRGGVDGRADQVPNQGGLQDARRCQASRRHRDGAAGELGHGAHHSTNFRGTPSSALFVAMSVAGIGTFYYYYEMPARAEMAKQEKQLKSLRADLDKARATAKKLPEFRAEVGQSRSTASTRCAPCCPKKKTPPICCGVCRRSPCSPTWSITRVQAVAGRHQTGARRVADHARARRQLSQSRGLLRSPRQVHAHRQHQRARSQRQGQQVAQPNVTIAAKCVATTFVLLDKAAIQAAKEKAQAKAGKPAPKPAAPAKKVA